MDISPALLRQMLEELERMGYLRRLENACELACSHCDRNLACAIHGTGEVWTLTDKKLPGQANGK